MFQILIALMIVCVIGAVVCGVKAVMIEHKNAPLDRQVREDIKAEKRRINGQMKP